MALDSVRPLKLETPAEGGSSTDFTPTEVNTLQDAIAAAGYFLDGPTVGAADKTVFVDRTTGGSLRLTDQTTSHVLGELVSSTLGQVGSHESLPSMAHFIGAPADGWASPYFVASYNGPLVTQRAWYTSSSMTQLIFKQTLTYLGPLIASVVSVIYSSSGTAARTVTDSYSYSGAAVTSIARSWS